MAPQKIFMLMALVALSQPVPCLGYSNRNPYCPCAKHSQDMTSRLYVEEETISSRHYTLFCCPETLIPSINDNYTITWTFKGKELTSNHSRSYCTFNEKFCGSESLETDSSLPSDEGNYTCTVTTSEGVTVSKTINLCVAVSDDTGEPPRESNMSPPQLALPKQRASFSCEAFVGLGGCGRILEHNITWFKIGDDGSRTPAEHLPRTTSSKLTKKGGMVAEELNINSVETSHYGTYICVVSNEHGVLTLNTTLKKGVPGAVMLAGHYRAVIVVITMTVVMLALIFFFWFRCRLMVALYYREKTFVSDPEDKHKYDLFVIHGESSTKWVWEVFLQVLEKNHGYTCFMIDREIAGGELLVDAITKAVSLCRHVLVVVTPCVLDNPWLVWALHRGVGAALSQNTHIFGVVLESIPNTPGRSENNKAKTILKTIRKIDVPICLRNFKANTSAAEPVTTAPMPCIANKNLRLPERTCPGIRSRSKSPKNQRLANMIIGSNATSKGKQETLEEKKKKKGKGKMKREEPEKLQELDSPCSITPFLFPSRSRPIQRGNRMTLSNCFKLICTGDPEQLFWQNIRLQLGPPLNFHKTTFTSKDYSI